MHPLAISKEKDACFGWELPKPGGMHIQTKQLRVRNRKLNPESSPGPAQLKSHSFLITPLNLASGPCAWSQIFIGACLSSEITDTFLHLMMFFLMSVQIE